MENQTNRSIGHFTSLLLLGWIFVTGCREAPPPPSPGDDPFFKTMNAQHNGDYLATYPMSSPDSCFARLKLEVPEGLQPHACMGLWYRFPRANPDSSFRFLDLYDKNCPHDTVFAFTQMLRGEFLVELRQYDTARTVLTDARSRYLRLNRPLDASDADYLMARCYNEKNNFPKALERYFGVLELLNQHDTTFSHRHYSLYLDISSAYKRAKDYSKEMFWLKKAWFSDYTKLGPASNYKIRIALRMSTNYAKTSPDSALVMARLAADIFRDSLKGLPPPQLQFTLGFARFKAGDCASALPLFLDAYRRNTEKNNPVFQLQLVQSLAESYYCLGKLDSASWFFSQTLDTPDTTNLISIHRRLSEINARRSDYKSALAEMTTASNLVQRLYASERAAALSEFEVRYETAEKAHQILEFKQQNKSEQQLQLIYGLVSLMLLGLAVSFFFRLRGRRRILEQQVKIMAQEKELAEARELLHEKELKRSKTDLKKSQASLQNTQKELETTTQMLELKTMLIDELQMRLKTERTVSDEELEPGMASNERFSSMKILTEEDWSLFKSRFDEAFPGYLSNLKRKFPTLSAAEVRLFLLIRLGFENYEISDALGIAKRSAIRSRHRLTQKLGLSDSHDLEKFILGFE